MLVDTVRRDDPHPERLSEKSSGSYHVHGETCASKRFTQSMKALVRQGGAFTDGTRIVGVVPATTHPLVRPNNDGRSTISDNWQAQRVIRTIRLLEADMLAKEHAPVKPPMGNVSGLCL